MNLGSGWGYLWECIPTVLALVRHGGSDSLVDCFFSSKVGVAVGPPRPTTVVPGKTRVARPRWAKGSSEDGPKRSIVPSFILGSVVG